MHAAKATTAELQALATKRRRPKDTLLASVTPYTDRFLTCWPLSRSQPSPTTPAESFAKNSPGEKQSKNENNSNNNKEDAENENHNILCVYKPRWEHLPETETSHGPTDTQDLALYPFPSISCWHFRVGGGRSAKQHGKRLDDPKSFSGRGQELAKSPNIYNKQ